MGSSEEERLVQMVHDFMESDAPPPPPPTTPTTIGATSLHQQTLLLLEGILGDNTHAEMEVFDKALKHVRDAGDERKRSKVKKRLMMRLRMDGYDASLCRSSWVATMECPGGDASHFCPAEAEGDYEFIDIVMVDGNGVSTRILIDIDFRSQFELARPTSAYTQLSSTLPPIFVGKEEKLKKVVSLLCSAAQQSLRERGLHIPHGGDPATCRPSGSPAVKRLQPFPTPAAPSRTLPSSREGMPPPRARVGMLNPRGQKGLLSPASSLT